MRLLFLLLFIALDSYVALVFFKQKTRQNAFKSLAVLIGFTVVSSAITHLVIPITEQLTSLAQKVLLSFSVILLTAFICQLVAILFKRAIDWHRVNNSANLHRQPIRFAIERQEQLMTLATYFYFTGSLLILGGIWLDLAS